MTTRTTCLLLFALACFAPSVADDPTVYGDGVTDATAVTIADLLSEPERFVGQRVKVEGRITDVCPRMGCWIDIGDEERTIRFKVMDGVIEFGADTKGQAVVAEGLFTRRELSQEQALARARHLAEERGETFDPESVTGPTIVYRIDGTGAVVRKRFTVTVPEP